MRRVEGRRMSIPPQTAMMARGIEKTDPFKHSVTGSTRGALGCPQIGFESRRLNAIYALMAKRVRRVRNKYISGPETRLLEFLKQHFPDVKAQVRIHDQRVDMYIPAQDTYVQLDGVYWHGLDEKLDRPNAVIRKMRKDMLLNGMFIGAKSGPRLFRITDRQWVHLENTNQREQIIDLIKSANPGLTEFNGEPGYRNRK